MALFPICMSPEETDGDGLSAKQHCIGDEGAPSIKHILEVYGDGDPGSLALADLCRKANQEHDHRLEPEHDYQALFLFLKWLASAIILIKDAQETGQLFCAGVYARVFEDIKVEAEALLPHVKTLSGGPSDWNGVTTAAIAIYKWLRKSDSMLRALLE